MIKVGLAIALGLLCAARAEAGDCEATGPSRAAEPRLVAENVLEGLRYVALAAPGCSVEVTTVCADGPARAPVIEPLHGGVAALMVSRCDGVDAIGVLVQQRRLTIPPRGELPGDDRVGPLRRVRELPPWRPSIPSGLLLFGVLPFTLGYATVRRVARTRR